MSTKLNKDSRKKILNDPSLMYAPAFGASGANLQFAILRVLMSIDARLEEKENG